MLKVATVVKQFTIFALNLFYILSVFSYLHSGPIYRQHVCILVGSHNVNQQVPCISVLQSSYFKARLLNKFLYIYLSFCDQLQFKIHNLLKFTYQR